MATPDCRGCSKSAATPSAISAFGRRTESSIAQMMNESTYYNQNVEEFPINAALLKMVQGQRAPRSEKAKSPALRGTLKLDQLLTPKELLNSLQAEEPAPVQHFVANDRLEDVFRELAQQVRLKFQDIRAQLDLREGQVMKELEKALAQLQQEDRLHAENIHLDFQLQMEALVKRYCAVRCEIAKAASRYAKSDSQETPRKTSRSAKRIFEEPRPIKIQNIFRQNKLSPFLEVLSILSNNAPMEMINLKSNALLDEDATKLAKFLRTSQSYVRTINLARNQISDFGFISIVEALKINKTVKQINVKYNQITNTSLQFMENAYREEKHNYLQQIKVKGNRIDDQKLINGLKRKGVIVYP